MSLKNNFRGLIFVAIRSCTSGDHMGGKIRGVELFVTCRKTTKITKPGRPIPPIGQPTVLWTWEETRQPIRATSRDRLLSETS